MSLSKMWNVSFLNGDGHTIRSQRLVAKTMGHALAEALLMVKRAVMDPTLAGTKFIRVEPTWEVYNEVVVVE